MRTLFQSTARTIAVLMVDETDHITGLTGLTLTITASKNGAAFASITPTQAELANGWYTLALTTSHTDTLGDLAIHITATGADPCDILCQVVTATAGLSGSHLDAAVTSRMATYTQPTGFLAATFPTTVASTTNITGGTITTVTNLTNAPTSGDFTATMKTSIGTAVAASAVASVTGNVGGNVTGSVGSVLGGINTTGGTITTLDQLDTAQDSQHATTQGAIATAQNDLDTITGSDGVTLATTQANYAPAKAGDQMDLVNAPNATAVTAIQSGLATSSGVTAAFTEIKGATWSSTTDTLEDIRNALTTVGSDVLTNGTLLSLIAGAGFDTATDSLEAIRDRGDTAWITATGFSTHSAADVVTAMGTGTFLTAIPWNSAWDAEVQSEAADALAAFSWSTTAVILTSAYDAAKTAASQTSVNTVDTVVDAIKVSTDRFETMIVLDGSVYQFTANALELAPTGGSAPSAADIRTEMDNNSTKLAAIVADTNELQTDWANNGRLDLILDSRASQTSVDDVPTNAEFEARTILAASYALEATSQAILTDTAEIGAAGAGLTALASQASVNDIPTVAEFEARTLAAADYFNAATDEVALRSDGLDAITIPDHTGPPTTFVGYIKAIAARFYNRIVRTETTIDTYRDDGVTVATTQSYMASGSDEDVGEAS